MAGAMALNVLHEVMRKKYSDAPELNKIGEEALTKTLESNGRTAPTGNKLYGMALTGDILANTAYYRMIGGATTKETLWKGLLYGVAAGIGTLSLTKPLGLDDEPVNKNKKAQGLTMLYYIVGGLVTAGVHALMNCNKHKQNV